MSEPIYPDPRFPPSLYYRFFRLLAAHVQPRYSVELGVCGGGGSLHLALGWPYGRVIGIDLGDEFYAEQIEHIRQTCPNFTFWQVDSVFAASCVGDIRVDILFIDTTHTYEQTMAEFNAWLPLMQPGGIVMLDDLFRPGMDRAWEEVQGDKIRLDRLHVGGGGADTGGFGVVLL